MNWEVMINQKRYPMTIQPVEYMHGSDWVCSLSVQIDDATSDEIDTDLQEEMPGFVTECIHYALIDGWTAHGTFDEDTKPITWTVLLNGQPINREKIHSILN